MYSKNLQIKTTFSKQYVHRSLLHDGISSQQNQPKVSEKVMFILWVLIATESLRNHDVNGSCNAMLLLFQNLNSKDSLFIVRICFP